MTMHFVPAILTERIGWLLVHSVWQFSLAALFAILLLRILRHATSQTRYLTLLTLFLSCATLPAITWPWLAADSPATDERFPSPPSPGLNVAAAEPIELANNDLVLTQLEIILGESLEPSHLGMDSHDVAKISLRESIREWLPTLVSPDYSQSSGGLPVQEGLARRCFSATQWVHRPLPQEES